MMVGLGCHRYGSTWEEEESVGLVIIDNENFQRCLLDRSTMARENCIVVNLVGRGQLHRKSARKTAMAVGMGKENVLIDSQYSNAYVGAGYASIIHRKLVTMVVFCWPEGG